VSVACFFKNAESAALPLVKSLSPLLRKCVWLVDVSTPMWITYDCRKRHFYWVHVLLLYYLLW